MNSLFLTLLSEIESKAFFHPPKVQKTRVDVDMTSKINIREIISIFLVNHHNKIND
jgi:hypothetical protein